MALLTTPYQGGANYPRNRRLKRFTGFLGANSDENRRKSSNLPSMAPGGGQEVRCTGRAIATGGGVNTSRNTSSIQLD